MKNRMQKFALKIVNTFKREEGQDLIEYALVVALIAFAATTGMNSLATGINTAFTSISTTLNANI